MCLPGWTFKSFACVALILGLAAVSFAGSIGTDTIAATNAFGASSNGALTGPYQFTDTSHNTFLTMCFDATHNIDLGHYYKTTEYSVATLTSSDNVEFKNFTLTFQSHTYNDLQLFKAEAWLDAHLLADFNATTDTVINTTTGVNLQDAAWALFDPSGGWNSGSNSSAVLGFESQALANALNNTAGLDYSRFVIFSPSDPTGYGQGQMEMLPTPEPASFALFASGLLTLGGYARRRFRRV